jgi:DNA-binding CsgD family transcriptional regulator
VPEFYRLLDGVVIDDTEVFNDKLREWEDFYNYHRPHGGLGGQTPMKDSSSAPRPGCNQPPSVAHPPVRLSIHSPTRATLPARQRAVLVLRYFEDLPEAQVADLLGCSVGTVKTHASRGIRRLRELLGDELVPADPARVNDLAGQRRDNT